MRWWKVGVAATALLLGTACGEDIVEMEGTSTEGTEQVQGLNERSATEPAGAVPMTPEPTFEAQETSIPTATSSLAKPTPVSPTSTSPGPTATASGPAPAQMPDPTEPAPTSTSPAPTATSPAPTSTSPAPTATSPAPTSTSPAPTAPSLVPTATSPAPTPTSPAPTCERSNGCLEFEVSTAQELREAVEMSENFGEIRIEVAQGSYVLDSWRQEAHTANGIVLGPHEGGQLEVHNLVVISGPPTAGVNITTGGIPDDAPANAVSVPSRIFHVLPAGELVLNRIVLHGGQTGGTDAPADEMHGGAILNEGTLTINEGILRDNSAYGNGAAIHNLGALTINGTSIVDNETVYGQGAGIYNAETATANVRASIQDNAVGRPSSSGGGIYNRGTLTVANSRVRNNQGVDGANLRNAAGAALTLRNSLFEGGTESNPGGVTVERAQDLRDEGGNEMRRSPTPGPPES